jgi:hypothetical protein
LIRLRLQKRAENWSEWPLICNVDCAGSFIYGDFARSIYHDYYYR